MVGMLIRLLVLAALLTSPLLLLAPPVWAVLLVGLLVLSGLATFLQRHLEQTYRYRYLENRAQEAPARLVLWRFLLDREQYRFLLAEALVQAGQLSEAEQLATDRRTSEWLRHYVHYILARKARNIDKAVLEMEHVTRCQLPAQHAPAFRLDFARLLAEFRPERLNQARELAERARSEITQPIMRQLADGVIGVVQVAEGNPEEGLASLDGCLAGLASQSQNVMLIPALAEIERWAGRALWHSGRFPEARQRFEKAIGMTCLESVKRPATEDLEAMLEQLDGFNSAR